VYFSFLIVWNGKISSNRDCTFFHYCPTVCLFKLQTCNKQSNA